MATARSKPATWSDSSVATPPDWLAEVGKKSAICLSSRVRLMRNLCGLRFPHHAPHDEQRQVLHLVIKASRIQGEEFWTVYHGLAPSERNRLISDRLISPEFSVVEPHRAVLIDPRRRTSVMVNEEDHLRFQSLTAGWSLDEASTAVRGIVATWSEELEFAYSPRFGYLASSPFNCGSGMRISSMFHLIGLAHTKKLKDVLRALQLQKIVARGLFGENSRAVGAMVQLSITGDEIELMKGAGTYLIEEEQSARASISHDDVSRLAAEARDYAISSRGLTLADSLRVLAWVRWATSLELKGFPASLQDVDSRMRYLGVFDVASEEKIARRRAELLRDVLENRLRT